MADTIDVFAETLIYLAILDDIRGKRKGAFVLESYFQEGKVLMRDITLDGEIDI